MLHPVLNTPESRRALASRDIATVYRLLKQRGVSQRVIGYATGQSQSEVSEIIAGRPVLQAHVLERIADGLGIDRAWIGVSHGGVSNGDASPVSDGDRRYETPGTTRRWIVGRVRCRRVG